MKNRVLSLVLVFVVSQSLIVASRADQVVSLTGDPWPPYMLGELGKDATGGIGVTLMRQIFDRINGVDVRFPLLPWKRALQAVERGTMDGIGILLKTPEREQYLEYTEVLFASHDLVWYSTSKFPDGFGWKDFDDLKAHTLGVVRGHSHGEEADEAIESGRITVIQVTSADQMFNMLAKGRIDLAFANDAVGYAFAKQHAPDSEIIAAKRPVSEDIYYIGLSKKSTARQWIPKINEVISELRDEGVVDRIIRGD